MSDEERWRAFGLAVVGLTILVSLLAAYAIGRGGVL